MSEVVAVESLDAWDVVEKSNKPVLVQFSMRGCAPCNALRPRLKALAEQREDLLVVEVKIDKAPELAQRYAIRAVPSLKLLKDGQIVKEHMGLIDKAALDKFVGKA